MRSLFKNIIIAGAVFLALAALVQLSDIGRLCSLENIKSHGGYLACFVQEHYVVTAFAYTILYMGTVVTSLPLTGPIGIVGGFMFGFFPALIYSLIGGSLGALLVLFILRRMAARLRSVELSPRMARFKEGFTRYGYLYLLMLHFTVVTPFVVINSLAAFSDISWQTFLWTSCLGMTPSTTIYVYAGTQIASIESMGDLFSWHVLIIMIVLVSIMLLPIFMRSKSERMQS